MICSHLLRCRLLGLLLLVCWGSSLEAQDYYRAEEPSRCDSSVYTDRLGIRLLGQGFFRNNEYATELADDYTLPGYRLRLDVGYSPNTRLPVQLRLGVANLYYWGGISLSCGTGLSRSTLLERGWGSLYEVPSPSFLPSDHPTYTTASLDPR